MGGYYFANASRKSYGTNECFSEEITEKDEWNLSIHMDWFRMKAYLNRGPKYHKIDLTKEENKALIEAYYGMEKERKAANKRTVSKEEQERLDAAWWP